MERSHVINVENYIIVKKCFQQNWANRDLYKDKKTCVCITIDQNSCCLQEAKQHVTNGSDYIEAWFNVTRSSFITNIWLIFNNNFLGVAEWVAQLTCNWSVLNLNPIKSSLSFLEQKTFPSLLSSGWFQERIGSWFHNGTVLK